ncbi:MAG: 2-C-methyl-D-erythritol 4-phosphate cytidylyltransferase [Gammaproteobacteria bacterium]|nr:2-C-methyl-D-erythritol 4-phosphate cytidylyltransferase [Gammaproteobacteria bacterium]
MGGALPKQYQMLCGKPVLQHSMERLLGHPAISGLAAAIAADDAQFQCIADALRHYGKPLTVAPGGVERHHSVRNALRELARQAAADDWVLVHDAARPCVRKTDIDKLIAAAGRHGAGALLALRVSDTVKCADAAGFVMETRPRETLWLAQTPQMFRLGRLSEALDYVIKNNIRVTDDAAAIETLGERPQLVEGSADNIKITRPGDLALAEFYLERQEGCA